MAIRSLELLDFTAFRKAKLDLSPGINVFLGENGTGKTHAMKALYALASGVHRLQLPDSALDGCFRPAGHDLKRLRHHGSTRKHAEVVVHHDRGSIGWGIGGKRTRDSLAFHGDVPSASASVAFIPSREIIASFEGFIAAYQNRELAFDQTYYDLAVALSATALRVMPKPFRAAGKRIEELLGGKLVQEGGRFHVKGAGDSTLEASLMSEGMRKLATVLRLLENGGIRSKGLLLWDEPEANLNPKLTVLVADVLATLAKNEVQIVIASHDYLLTETLALLSKQKGGPPVRFFSFVRDGDSVTVTGEDDLNALPSNAIRDEFLAHYDRMRAAE